MLVELALAVAVWTPQPATCPTVIDRPVARVRCATWRHHRRRFSRPRQVVLVGDPPLLHIASP